MNTRPLRRCRTRVTSLALSALAAALLPFSAQAFKFGGETVSGSFDSTISLGFQKRLQGIDCHIVGNDNGGCVPVSGTLGELTTSNLGINSPPDFNYLNADDGDLNYHKNDIVSMALKGTHDLFLRFPEKVTALVRGTWIKDFKADDTQRTPLSEDAKDLAVHNFSWLDAWVAKEFSIVDRPAKVKIGNQVISWGEDIFIYGGVNIINGIDLRKFHTPGTQLKEVFRPAPMISLNAGVSDNVSIEAYYQWKWNGFRFDPVGTYFSTADVVGKGAGPAYVPTSIANNFELPGSPWPAGSVGDPGGPHGLSEAQLADPTVNPVYGVPLGNAFGSVVPRGNTRQPKDSGQYGAALRYKADAINSELAFYYLHYHDKIPFIGFSNTGTTSNILGLEYFQDYGEDRHLYGMSINTKVGDVAVGGEISYRPKDSVGIDPTVPAPPNPYSVFLAPGTVQRGFVDEEKWQAHLTGFYLISPSGPLGGIMRGLGASEGFILAEAAVAYYPNLDRTGFTPYLLPNYELPNNTSWGYVFEVGLTYPNAFGSGWNVTPQLDFAHDVQGTSPNTIPFVEGRKAATVQLIFDYESLWKGSVGMTRFWGGGDNNLLRDRDFLFASIARSF